MSLVNNVSVTFGEGMIVGELKKEIQRVIAITLANIIDAASLTISKINVDISDDNQYERIIGEMSRGMIEFKPLKQVLNPSRLVSRIFQENSKETIEVLVELPEGKAICCGGVPVVTSSIWVLAAEITPDANHARKRKNPGRCPSKRNGVPTCSREYPLSIRKSSYLRSHLTNFPILPTWLPWTASKLVNLRITSHSSIWDGPSSRRFLSRRQATGSRRRSAGSTFTAPLGHFLAALVFSLVQQGSRVVYIPGSRAAVRLCQTLIETFKQHYCLRTHLHFLLSQSARLPAETEWACRGNSGD